MKFDVKELVDLFYHPRMSKLLGKDFQQRLSHWQKELRAENSTALGQILSYYPTVMLAGPAQSGKTSLVSGLLQFGEGKRSEWINRHAGTGALSKTKVPTRYVADSAEEIENIPLQPEMDKEVRRIFEDILVKAPEKLEEGSDEVEKATTKVIMTNQRHPLNHALLRPSGKFSVLDMPGTAASGSNLEELFSNTQKQKYRIFNLLKERYLLYRIFPDVAQVLIVVAPLQNLGSAKWAQEDVIDKFLSRHLNENCSLKEIICKYRKRTILCIPDLNKWNRRENWKKEYWQSLKSLQEQFAFEDLSSVVFIRSPEVDEAYESLYDSVFNDLLEDPSFAVVLKAQQKGFMDRENRGFEFLSQKIWEALNQAQDVGNVRKNILEECTQKLLELGLCQKNPRVENLRKILPADEIEYFSSPSIPKGEGMAPLEIKKLDYKGEYVPLYQNLGEVAPGRLYHLLQKMMEMVAEGYEEGKNKAAVMSDENPGYIILLDENSLGGEGDEWKKLKDQWRKSDFPLHHFTDQDFQEAHRILLYQSTLGSQKKIIHPYRIQPMPLNEKASFLARPTRFIAEEEPLEEMFHEEDEHPFPISVVKMPFAFDSGSAFIWEKKKLENILILFHHHSPEAFLRPGRFLYLTDHKKLRSYALKEVLSKFKKQELTLQEIFQSLDIQISSTLVMLEYEKGKALLC